MRQLRGLSTSPTIPGAQRFTDTATRPVRILIVDDMELDREILSKRMRVGVPNGIPIEARSKFEAIALARTHHFDLALVDMRLPWEGNGLAVMRALREKRPLIPICAYSGSICGDDVAAICREVGPVIVADKTELMRGKFLTELFAQCRLGRRAGLEG